MISVKHAEYICDYIILIEFNDGLNGKIDFYKLLKPDTRKILSDLLDINVFKKFKVDLDTIVWDNGADLAPDFLYDLVKEKRFVA